MLPKREKEIAMNGLLKRKGYPIPTPWKNKRKHPSIPNIKKGTLWGNVSSKEGVIYRKHPNPDSSQTCVWMSCKEKVKLKSTP